MLTLSQLNTIHMTLYTPVNSIQHKYNHSYSKYTKCINSWYLIFILNAYFNFPNKKLNFAR